jgi:hypothetical protein
VPCCADGVFQSVSLLRGPGHSASGPAPRPHRTRRPGDTSPTRPRPATSLPHHGVGHPAPISAGAADQKVLIDTAASGETKTGESRTVVPPLSWLRSCEPISSSGSDWKPGSLIFPGERGAMLDGGNFRRRVFALASVRAEVNDGLRVNDLRHSAVSFAVAHRANVYHVSKMVGHSKPSITLDVYGELWDDSQEQLATKLDEAIRAEMVA